MFLFKSIALLYEKEKLLLYNSIMMKITLSNQKCTRKCMLINRMISTFLDNKLHVEKDCPQQLK